MIPETETAEPTKPRTARRAAHLVLGVDDRIASTVFGTITAMATVTVYGKAFPDSPWKVEELVASTAVVLWIAHLYTHALSESISEGRRLNGARVWSLAVRELGILLAAIPPTIALTLGALGLFDETASIWLALGLGLAILAVEGVRYARIERLGSAGLLLAVVHERRDRPARRPAQGRSPALNRSTRRPWRRPRSLTVSSSQCSLSSTVRTMHAPARITSARAGCRPTISRRRSAVRLR